MHSTVAMMKKVAMIRRALDLTAYIFRLNFPKSRCALQSWGTRLDICMDADLKTRDKSYPQ